MTVSDDVGMIRRVTTVNQSVDKETIDDLCDEMTDVLVQKLGKLHLNEKLNFHVMNEVVEHLHVTAVMTAILGDMFDKKTSLSKAKEKTDFLISRYSISVKQEIKKNLADAFMKVKNADGSGIVNFVIKK